MNNPISREAGSAFAGKKYLTLIIILIGGTALRFYHNLDISLWHDEAFSALMIRYPWGEMFYRLGLDVHPPMYYIFLRFWHYAFGDSLLSLRAFSVLFSTGSIWAAWLFVKKAFQSEKMALWTAALVALSPFQLMNVPEARMYTFGIFFSLLAAYFLVSALQNQKKYFGDEKLNMPNLPQDISLKRTYRWQFFGFAVSTGIIILTHYYLLFTAVALGFYGLLYTWYHYRGAWKKYVALKSSFLLIIIFFLPWLKTFLFQYRQVQAGYWIPPINTWSIPGTFWTMLLGIGHDDTNKTTQKVLVLVVLFCMFFFWRFLKRTDSWSKWLVFFCTLAPFGGAILFVVLSKLKGSNSSVYEERYFLYAGSFFVIALAGWLSELRYKKIAQSLFLAYLAFNLYAFWHFWQGLDIAHKPGMNGAAKFLANNVEPGQHVFVASSFEFFNYKYYASTVYRLPSGVQPLLYTGGRSDIKQISHIEGVALLSNADLLPDYKTGVKTGDTVWVLWTYAFGGQHPNLPGNWRQIDEKQYPDVRPYVGTTIYATEYIIN